MEISGDKSKLENLVRSLYTETLDGLHDKFSSTMEKLTFHWYQFTEVFLDNRKATLILGENGRVNLQC